MRGKFAETIMASVTWLSAGFTFGALALLAGFIFAKGVPHLKLSLFSLEYNSENVSLMPALISTIIMTVLSLLLAVPLGVSAAIYLAEYAPRGSSAVRLIRTTAETLSGIPSIVYGLFGMLCFVTFLGWGFSLLSGALTLSIMILPLVMRSAEEAILAVPDAYREGVFALGAGKSRAVFRVVLPSAAPGILAGAVLAVGRIAGETAALIYTAGTATRIPGTPMQSARTLAVHMYALSSEGLHTDEAYATAAVLMAVVVLINAVSAAIARRIGSPS